MGKVYSYTVVTEYFCKKGMSPKEIPDNFIKTLGDVSFLHWLITCMLGFNDTSTLVGHFVSSRDSRRDKRQEQGRKRNRTESEETEEIKTFPATGIAGLAQL